MKENMDNKRKGVWSSGRSVSYTHLKNAGAFTIGVLEGSSALGLSEEEFTSLSAEEKAEQMQRTQEKFTRAGADLVIRDLSELPEIIEKGVFII